MSGKTAKSPGSTIEITKGSPSEPGTVTDSGTLYPCLLVEPDIGAIYNGVKAMTADYGDSNVAEGDVFQLEIMAVHPQSNTPNDKTTAFKTNDSVIKVKHVIGKSYWLKASSITAAKGDKLIGAGSGLVKKSLAHTATPKSKNYWVVDKKVASQTYVQATYKGQTMFFTTGA